MTVKGVDNFSAQIADYALITMGGRIHHYEENIVDGVLRVDHHFQPLNDSLEKSYYNQMHYPDEGEPTNDMRMAGLDYNAPEDYKIKSHVIVWLYKRHWEDQLNKGKGWQKLDPSKMPSGDTEGHMARRCYLIGSTVLDLQRLMDVNIKLNSGDEVDTPTFNCKHNFCDTHSKCKLVKHNGFEVEEQQGQLHMLIKGLEKYINEEKDTNEKDGSYKKPDHSNNPFMVSPLANLANVNEIVKLQQGLMKTYCVIGMQSGKLFLGDQMGAAFVSGATFTQLYGAAVLFTDMSHIVRYRVVEFPFEMIAIYMDIALRVNGYTANDVARMNSDVYAGDLLMVYKSLISAEIMDSKQAEYYSDYCLYGVEKATEYDFVNNRQPIPDYDTNKMGELWFYEKTGNETYVRYRMKLTEDQRQICTGRNLRNRIVADDCESSASTIKGIHKTCIAIQAKLVLLGVLKADKVDDEVFMSFLDNPEGNQEFLKFVDQFAPTSRFGEGWTLDSRAALLLALANVMRQFEFRLDLCIGTANAAGVGQATNLCGHCYLILKTRHYETGAKVNCVIEGTNWVSQKKMVEEDEGESSVPMATINELASILMEMTKDPKFDPKEDIGKGLVKMCEDKGVKFYARVYVSGDEMHFIVERDQNGKKVRVFGEPVPNVVDNMPSERIEVNYKLVSEHLKRLGKDVDPFTIKNTVRLIAKEATVPAWPKGNWDKLMGEFYATRVMYGEGTQGFVNVPKYNRAEHIRFVFVHQLYDIGIKKEDRENTAKDISKNIVDVLLGKKPPPISQRHWDSIAKPPDGFQGEWDPRFKNPFNVEKTNSHAKGVQDMVFLEQVFTAMQSVVTVCFIHKDMAQGAHDQLMEWVKSISVINKERTDVVNKWKANEFRHKESGDGGISVMGNKM